MTGGGQLGMKPTDALADVPPEKHFRRECLDLAIGNELSATRTARLAQSAVLAGAGNVKDLAKDKRKTTWLGTCSGKRSATPTGRVCIWQIYP